MLKTENGLSIQQEQAVNLLAAGKSITSTAEEVGVARQTVHKWMNEPNFYRALERAVNGFNQELLLVAMGQLEDILKTGRSSDKLKAIQLILEMNGKTRGNGQNVNLIMDQPKVTVEDILREIENM